MIIKKDKIQHFVLSFVLAALIYWLTKNYFLTIITVLLLGLIKEVIDQKRRKNNFYQSGLDILADGLGIILGLMIAQYLL